MENIFESEQIQNRNERKKYADFSKQIKMVMVGAR